MKVIELSYQKNVRDLVGMVGFNGKKVKEGRIYRGGVLSRVSEKDIEKINSLKLTDIIDFRGEIEFNERPDYRFEGVRYHNFPALKMEEDENKNSAIADDSNLLWFIKDGMSGFEHMFGVYSTIPVSEEGINAYKNFFKVLLESDDRVVYFHCSQGKDRAGFASYLLEIALGVNEEVAREDYLFTNVAMESKIKQLKAMLYMKPFYNSEYEKNLEDVFSAKEEYLDGAIKVVNSKYGNVLNYLRTALEVDIDKLREIYLE